jgi:pimeloyl-ACP methyl ester carboxylesterase
MGSLSRGGGALETVECGGLRIAYERAGSGPPLVLLHGYVADGRTTWQAQIEALADEFTVVAWDAPGAGGSSDPPESLGIFGYADCLARFVELLGFDRPNVAGLSFGGALALAFAARHPEMTNALVLASAYAGWFGSLPSDVAQQRLDQALQLSHVPPEEFVDALLPTMFSSAVPAQVVDAFGAALRAFHPSGFRALARASAEDLRPVLSNVIAPVLLVYGDDDVRAPAEVSAKLQAALARSTLVTLRGVGHCCNIEAPHAFNRELRNFLRTHQPKAP